MEQKFDLNELTKACPDCNDVCYLSRKNDKIMRYRCFGKCGNWHEIESKTI